MGKRLTQSLFSTSTFLAVVLTFAGIGFTVFSMLAAFLFLLIAVSFGGIAGWMVYIASENDWE